MSIFIGVIRHEFKMTVRRPGMWIAYILLYIFYGVLLLTPDPNSTASPLLLDELWQEAGMVMFDANMFMVLVGGILSADRMQRDIKLGVRELQRSSPLKLPVYILAKYLGVLSGVMLPMLVWVILVSIYGITQGAPVTFIGIMLTAFLAMGVPAYAFVVAYSIACPLIIPLRVYQVLFTGYWFWGNYLNAGVFPTISDTLLVPSGKYVLGGFFGGVPSDNSIDLYSAYTTTDATLNLIILALCVVIVLNVLNIYLRWKERNG